MIGNAVHRVLCGGSFALTTYITLGDGKGVSVFHYVTSDHFMTLFWDIKGWWILRRRFGFKVIEWLLRILIQAHKDRQIDRPIQI